MKPGRVAVTGASGLVGSALVPALRRDGCEVMAVARPRGVLDTAALEGADAVVHLAGAPIGRRWMAARKREILDSRVSGTQRVAEAIARARPTPRSLICASAVGYYGNRGDEWLDEDSVPGTDFLAEVTAAWERAAEPARAAGVRVVHLRLGIVLSPGGGALPRMLTPFSLGVGGRLGNGRQWMSWIALSDLLSVFRFALASDELSGAVNAVAPEPVTNAEFARTLARVLRRPAIFPVPAVVLRAIFGEMAGATILASQRARPARLERAGFRFAQPRLESALRHELGR
ncbi:MAG: TIGR01777 family oxidoreductase [Gemmatimonadales bacterium]